MEMIVFPVYNSGVKSSDGINGEKMQVETASLCGFKMKYCSFGTGKRVFAILPGLSVRNVTDSAEAVAKAYGAFTDTFTVYLFDRREDVPEGYSIRDMADDTAAVIRSLGIGSAALFGASQGGMIAQMLAIAYPELVERLILGSTACEISPFFAERCESWKRLASEHDHRGLTETFVDWMYGEDTLRLRRETLLASTPTYTDAELSRFLRLVDAFHGFTTRETLSGIACPTLVLAAKGDQVFGYKASLEIADILGCEIHLYGSGYGHAVYDEAPDYIPRMGSFCGTK